MARPKLNPNQKVFCQLYAGGGEHFGNGVWSYVIAYKLKVPLISYSSLNESQKREYAVAKQTASELLTKPYIIEKCNELVDALIKDEIVDRELVRVIMQNDELSAKVSAIKEYNQLKSRIKQPGGDSENPLFIQIAESIAKKNDTNPSPKPDSE